jgi:aryl-alcohol dehydrogenase-like predicted oxidoreductase
MNVDRADFVSIGTTGVAVTRLGFGAASIGGLFAEVEERTRGAANGWITIGTTPLKEFNAR